MFFRRVFEIQEMPISYCAKFYIGFRQTTVKSTLSAMIGLDVTELQMISLLYKSVCWIIKGASGPLIIVPLRVSTS